MVDSTSLTKLSRLISRVIFRGTLHLPAAVDARSRDGDVPVCLDCVGFAARHMARFRGSSPSTARPEAAMESQAGGEEGERKLSTLPGRSGG
ncbi:hypothetical protein S7711_10820 [Stachybotrys chartarum IBT 7711]|uniref:Uncharacterized protein n=1 Tax=Stachybotrys chartarum (strain CBS 109288 / IBT 7711) TaxID=1280523 RepID=A0A084AJ94_STACB|nr:hypothetical protein S7711_10820 [Stachybotrys chartarum IBT 7711]KFA51168.1 hypothetical protein S40293_10842 [Stachybotrys chartarum IBT 40293]